MGYFKSGVTVLALAVLINFLPSLLTPKKPIVLGGKCAPAFSAVEKAYREIIETGIERGSSFAVYHQGVPVCSLWGGYADDGMHIPWEEDTLTLVYSTTKAITAISVALLYDRGLLDYDKKVSHYWPEFAQNGKEEITVKQLMSHQAGLPIIDGRVVTSKLIKDQPEEVSMILASQKPVWKLGSGHGYHGLTIGLYADQLIRKIDPKKRSLAKFFEEEIAKPFDIDFHFILPNELHYRKSRTLDMTTADMLKSLFTNPSGFKLFWNLLFKKDSFMAKMLANPKDPEDDLPGRGNRKNGWVTLNGSGSGHSNALALAKLFGILSNGGKYKGKTLMSTKGLNILKTAVTKREEDKILYLDIQYGHGLTMLNSLINPENLNYGAPGAGGQMGYADPNEKLGWGYVTAYPLPSFTGFKDVRYIPLEKAMYESVKALKK